MGDSAYNKAELKENVKVLVPATLPQDGAPPSVRDLDHIGQFITLHTNRAHN